VELKFNYKNLWMDLLGRIEGIESSGEEGETKIKYNYQKRKKQKN